MGRPLFRRELWAPLALEPEGCGSERRGADTAPCAPQAKGSLSPRPAQPVLGQQAQVRPDGVTCSLVPWAPEPGLPLACTSPQPRGAEEGSPRATQEAPAGDGPHVATAENKISLPARC